MIPVGLPKGATPAININPSRVPKCPKVSKSGTVCGRAWAVPFFAKNESTLSYMCGADPSWPGCGHTWKSKS
jgi:hypothetical protein